MVLVRPDEVTQIKMLMGMPYQYTIAQIFFQRTQTDPEDFGLEKMMAESEYRNGKYVNVMSHFLQSNPILPLRGLSPVISMLDDIQVLVKGRKWNRSMLENEGRPSGVFYFPPRTVGADENNDFVGAKKLEEDMKKNFSGHKNIGKALVLRGGLQFKEITYNMKDLDFLNGLKFSRETIANRLGIPTQLFGSEKSSTYNLSLIHI